MNKNTKRNLKISSVIFGVGAIAASITLPLVLTGKTLSTTLDMDDVILTIPGKDGKNIEIKAKDIVNRTGDIGEKNTNKLSRLDYYLAFWLYDAEQKASLKLQERFFEWEIFSLNNKIEENQKDSKKSKEDKDKLDKELKDQLNSFEKKLNQIKEAIKNDGKGLDYNSFSFKNDFPKVLLPLENIKNEQTKRYQDEKNNTIKNAATRSQGQINWDSQIREKYNGAVSDEEAIDYLVYKAVEKNAFGEFGFKINSEFTFEQKWARNKDGEFIFPFLKDAVQKKGLKKPTISSNKDFEDVLNSDKESKVYFIGTESSDLTKIVLDLNNSKIIESIITQNLIKVQHALLAVKQNAKGAALPWEFIKDKNTLLKLLSFFGDAKKGQKLIDILPNLFKEGKEEETKMIIDNFTDDSSGKGKDGSLGVKTIFEYIEEMVGGFGFGILALQKKGADGQNSEKENFLTELQKNLEAAKKSVWGENIAQNQSGLKQQVDALKDKEIDEFANAIRKTFDPASEGLKLSYPVGKGVNIVISEHGVHVVKITEFGSKEKIKEEINKDLNIIANEQDDKKSHTNWGDLFSNHFKSKNNNSNIGVNARRKFLIDNLDKKAFEDFMDKEENKRKISDPIKLEDMNSVIISNENSRKVQEVLNALGTKVKDFYEKEINEMLRVVDEDLKPGDVFNFLIELALKERSL